MIVYAPNLFFIFYSENPDPLVLPRGPEGAGEGGGREEEVLCVRHRVPARRRRVRADTPVVWETPSPSYWFYIVAVEVVSLLIL